MDPPTAFSEEIGEDSGGLSQVSHLIRALLQTSAVTRRQSPLTQFAQAQEEGFDPARDLKSYEQYATGTVQYTRLFPYMSTNTYSEELYLTWYEHFHELTPRKLN